MKMMQLTTRVASALLSSLAFADGEPPTGWISPLATATYDWSETANWTNGVINGVFGSNLVGSGKTFPVIAFTEDTTLTNGLYLAYYNSEQNLAFRGSGGDRTLILKSDIKVDITGRTTKGGISFGSTTADQNLNVDLDGARTFSFDALGSTVYGVITNGSLTVTGETGNNANLVLSGNGRIDAATPVRFTTGRGLYVYEKGQYVYGCKRAGDVRLESGYLVYEGSEKAGHATEDSIGTLTLAPGEYGGGICRFQNYGSSGYYGAHLTIAEIVREQETMFDLHSANGILGAGAIGDKGSLNVTCTKAPLTIGSGAAGTTSVPIVPWARGSTSDSQTTDTMFYSLVTYDAERGFRLLDADTEYETYASGMQTSIASSDANVRVTGGTVDFLGDSQVNSLSTLSGNAVNIYHTNGVMKIASGALDLSVWNNVTVNGNFDFGNTTAYITQCGNKSATLKGTITGKDVVFGDNLMRAVSSGAPLALQSAATLTGDVYVNGSVSIANDSFFPHGDETGKTYVNGRLRIFCGAVTLNGLYGSGDIVYGQSYATELKIGDNDACGDFAGYVTQGGGTLNITKIGSGKQRFGGDITLSKGALKVSSGTAIFDGTVTVTSGTITIADGSTIGGKGTFASPVACTKDVTFSVTPTSGVLPCLTFGDGITVGGKVKVSVEAGKWRCAQMILKSSSSLEGISFERTTRDTLGELELRNEDKELWAYPRAGLAVFFR